MGGRRNKQGGEVEKKGGNQTDRQHSLHVGQCRAIKFLPHLHPASLIEIEESKAGVCRVLVRHCSNFQKQQIGAAGPCILVLSAVQAEVGLLELCVVAVEGAYLRNSQE